MKTPDGSVCIIEAYSFLPPLSSRSDVFFGKNKKYILYHLLGKMTTIFPCMRSSRKKKQYASLRKSYEHQGFQKPKKSVILPGDSPLNDSAHHISRGLSFGEPL